MSSHVDYQKIESKLVQVYISPELATLAVL